MLAFLLSCAAALAVLVVGSAIADRYAVSVGYVAVGAFLLGAVFTLATWPVAVNRYNAAASAPTERVS